VNPSTSKAVVATCSGASLCESVSCDKAMVGLFLSFAISVDVTRAKAAHEYTQYATSLPTSLSTAFLSPTSSFVQVSLGPYILRSSSSRCVFGPVCTIIIVFIVTSGEARWFVPHALDTL
jgi:hypothetical protein